MSNQDILEALNNVENEFKKIEKVLQQSGKEIEDCIKLILNQLREELDQFKEDLVAAIEQRISGKVKELDEKEEQELEESEKKELSLYHI